MIQAAKSWSRPLADRKQPKRVASGYYRAALDANASGSLYGIPLLTAQDTAVSAVRAAYRVVDAQMERGARIARSLREASERQGVGDPAEALDAGERLARKAVLAGVEWMETLVAQPGNPVKRALSAEYRWLGAALGLAAMPQPDRASAPSPASADAPADAELRARYSVGPMGPVARIMHEKDSAFRAVTIVGWLVDKAIPATGSTALRFFNTSDPGGGVLTGVLTVKQDVPVMELNTQDSHRSGRWRSALCDSSNLQFGIVEIEL